MSDFRFRVEETSDLTKKRIHSKKHSTTALQIEKHQKKPVGALVRLLWRAAAAGLKHLRLLRARNEASSCPGSPELPAFTMSLAPPVHPPPSSWRTQKTCSAIPARSCMPRAISVSISKCLFLSLLLDQLPVPHFVTKWELYYKPQTQDCIINNIIIAVENSARINRSWVRGSWGYLEVKGRKGMTEVKRGMTLRQPGAKTRKDSCSTNSNLINEMAHTLWRYLSCKSNDIKNSKSCCYCFMRNSLVALLDDQCLLFCSIAVYNAHAVYNLSSEVHNTDIHISR